MNQVIIDKFNSLTEKYDENVALESMSLLLSMAIAVFVMEEDDEMIDIDLNQGFMSYVQNLVETKFMKHNVTGKSPLDKKIEIWKSTNQSVRQQLVNLIRENHKQKAKE